MIRCWVADASGARTVSLAEACAFAQGPAGNVWIDLEAESEEAIRATVEPLGVHPLVVDDVVMEVNRPKVDDYGDYLYLVVHSARWEVGEPRPSLREIDVILGARVLVTAHEHPTRSASAAAEVIGRRPELLSRSPAVLLHWLLDVLVDHYIPIVDRLAEGVDQLEEDVFGRPDTRAQERIIHLKRGMASLRRIVGPQRDTVLALTRDEYRAIPADVRPYLRDVYDRLARVSDMLDSFRDEVASLLDLYVSITSHRLNEVIKRLTVLATIGLPLTVITSYYGMNVKIHAFEWPHGELFVLGLLALTGFATWAYLRWKRWD